MSTEAIKAIQMVYANTTKHDWPDDIWEAICQAIDAASQLPEAEKQEQGAPVAWMKEQWSPDCGPYIEFYRDDEMGWRDRKEWAPLYTHPQPKREWVGLTDEGMRDIEKQFNAERVRTPDEASTHFLRLANWHKTKSQNWHSNTSNKERSFMSNTKHTPGPWRIGSLESYDGYTGQPYRNVWARQDEAATVVARAIRSDGAMTNDVDADARLIAAAPELLEALQLALSAHGKLLLSDPPQEAWKTYGVETKARAAIAKATGGAV